MSDHLADEPALAWRPDIADDRQERLAARCRSTPAWRRWGAMGVAAVVSGPFAILAALVANSTGGAGLLVLVVVLAPATEEVLKASGALLVAERRPWLVPSGWSLPLVTLVSGICFAVVENLWYLEVLLDDPSETVVRVRWIAGPLVHGVCSTIAGLGARRLWQRTLARGVGRFGDAEPFLVAAAVVHGGWNLLATLASVAGRVF
ncbi:MAG: PrsW family intramembrane metalloprotease [Actinomycetota bacterium]|nr:PrsW family intramembrane metalloprotease [Actinomycetota bacterium]